MRRGRPVPATGEAACELLDTCVVAAGHESDEALRVDVYRVLSASNDPRIAPKPENAPPALILAMAKSRRSHAGLIGRGALGYAARAHGRQFEEQDRGPGSDDSDDDVARIRGRTSESSFAGPTVRSHGLSLLGMMRRNISGKTMGRHD